MAQATIRFVLDVKLREGADLVAALDRAQENPLAYLAGVQGPDVAKAKVNSSDLPAFGPLGEKIFARLFAVVAGVMLASFALLVLVILGMSALMAFDIRTPHISPTNFGNIMNWLVPIAFFSGLGTCLMCGGHNWLADRKARKARVAKTA